MTENIKIALIKWAKKVLNNNSQWDEEKTHELIQKLYEISIVQKMLMEHDALDKNLWKQQQAQLSEVIESLTGDTQIENEKEENMEVAPMMDTIKNMVTEMPEPETYEKLFETVEEMPTFIPKEKEIPSPSEDKNIENKKIEERKNINDNFSNALTIDMNDRLSFIKYLFNGEVKSYEKVLKQIITFDSWTDAFTFIERHVKSEYDHWKGKEDITKRFHSVLKKNFERE